MAAKCPERIYLTTRSHIPGEKDFRTHHHDSLKSGTISYWSPIPDESSLRGKDSNAGRQVKQFTALSLPNAQDDRYTPFKDAPLATFK
jgi:hypothetical protein